MKKEIGALYSVFPCSASHILDHMIAMKEYDYSITDISKISGIGFKTTLKLIHNFADQDILKLTRSIGRAKLYQFNSNAIQSKSIEKLAWNIAKKSISVKVKKIKN